MMTMCPADAGDVWTTKMKIVQGVAEELTTMTMMTDRKFARRFVTSMTMMKRLDPAAGDPGRKRRNGMSSALLRW